MQSNIVELELGRVEDEGRSIFDYIETGCLLARGLDITNAGELWRADGRFCPADSLDGRDALEGEVLKVSSDSEVVMARFNVCWQSEFGHW